MNYEINKALRNIAAPDEVTKAMPRFLTRAKRARRGFRLIPQAPRRGVEVAARRGRRARLFGGAEPRRAFDSDVAPRRAVSGARRAVGGSRQVGAMALPARELRKSAAPMRAAGRRLFGGGAAPRRAEGIAAPQRSTGKNRIFPNNAKPQRAVNPNNPVIKPDVETPGSKLQGNMGKIKDFTVRNKTPLLAGAAAGTAGYAAGRVQKSRYNKDDPYQRDADRAGRRLIGGALGTSAGVGTTFAGAGVAGAGRNLKTRAIGAGLALAGLGGTKLGTRSMERGARGITEADERGYIPRLGMKDPYATRDRNMKRNSAYFKEKAKMGDEQAQSTLNWKPYYERGGVKKAAPDKIITRAGTILSPANNRLQRRIAGHGANVASRGSARQILKSSKFTKEENRQGRKRRIGGAAVAGYSGLGVLGAGAMMGVRPGMKNAAEWARDESKFAYRNNSSDYKRLRRDAAQLKVGYKSMPKQAAKTGLLYGGLTAAGLALRSSGKKARKEAAANRVYKSSNEYKKRARKQEVTAAALGTAGVGAAGSAAIAPFAQAREVKRANANYRAGNTKAGIRAAKNAKILSRLALNPTVTVGGTVLAAGSAGLSRKAQTERTKSRLYEAGIIKSDTRKQLRQMRAEDKASAKKWTRAELATGAASIGLFGAGAGAAARGARSVKTLRGLKSQAEKLNRASEGVKGRGLERYRPSGPRPSTFWDTARDKAYKEQKVLRRVNRGGTAAALAGVGTGVASAYSGSKSSKASNRYLDRANIIRSPKRHGVELTERAARDLAPKKRS